MEIQDKKTQLKSLLNSVKQLLEYQFQLQKLGIDITEMTDNIIDSTTSYVAMQYSKTDEQFEEIIIEILDTNNQQSNHTINSLVEHLFLNYESQE